MTNTSLARITLDAALSVGLRWLYTTEQPTDALVEPSGARLAAVGRHLRFLPLGGHDGNPLIVIDAVIPHWVPVNSGPPLSTLTRAELDTVAEELANIGVKPSQWQCHAITSTIVLKTPAHPSLRAAVDRYRAGCPYHRSLVCDAPVGCGGHGCPWHAAGHDRARWPQLTETDMAAAALQGHPFLADPDHGRCGEPAGVRR
ncbi:hypothetical protein P5V34_04635 [Mycobacteroides abscessus subsp. abscessus]|jgi:hypothetical protein|uniref:hypothetical protein n=1 Tax=Mycobacteroides abscessus TaxID=36809 RepID=UPI00266C0245|nr:hypothetical protein [Mycobacteroides abscessus]MDO3013273.1 hypothetical protein [Mycobacteroides abscessus subsp. abscessus]